MNHIKLFEEFLNEAKEMSLEDVSEEFQYLNESIDVEFENAPDEINLEHEKGKVVIDLSVFTLKEILSSLTKAKSNLSKLDGSVKITATDENGDSDRGLGMEWTLGDGSVIYGPDFGMTDNVKSALEELNKFLKEFKKSYSSLSREEKEHSISINFD